jgi:hypothetical protein
MFETIAKIIGSSKLKKIHKLLYFTSLALLLLHLVASLLPFFAYLVDSKVTEIDKTWFSYFSEQLVSISDKLMGITGGLLLVVFLGATLRALGDSEKRFRKEVSEFIQGRLEEWFREKFKSRDKAKHFIDKAAIVSFTDFKIVGDADENHLADIACSNALCAKVHFEFTFYPRKLIYGIHFEFSSKDLNEQYCIYIQDFLGFNDKSSFHVDHEIPKKPGWVFLINNVELSGKLESDMPTILTHARHFVELVGHNYEFLYSREAVLHFNALIASGAHPFPEGNSAEAA